MATGYNRVQTLSQVLVDDRAKQQEKRTAAKELVSQLGNFDTRRRLAQEATPDYGSTPNLGAARHRALSEMWKLVIQRVLAYVESTMDSKKVKLNREDVSFPVKLIKLAHTYDVDIDYTADSKDTPRPRLSRKELKAVLKFCLELLDDDSSLAVAENELLDLLVFICSRQEYVCHMNPVPEMQMILEEIEGRLLFDPEFPADQVQRTNASKAFQSLMSTAADMGMGLHLLLPGCVKMVSRWINRQASEQTLHTAAEFVPIIDGLQRLIRRHPDLAVAPLKRHGKIILAASKRRYADATSCAERRVLNDFFRSYLIVAQMAGTLEGKMDGDLGSLGEASIHLEDMLEILNVIVESPDRVDGYSSNNRVEAQQCQFELFASLLICSQRAYLVKHMWDEIENPTKFFLSHVEGLSEQSQRLQYDPTSGDKLVYSSGSLEESPSVSLILKKLARRMKNEETNAVGKHQLASTLFSPNSSASLPYPARTCFLLKALTATLEVSPTGMCWVMSAQTAWLEPSKDQLSCSNAMSVQVCSPHELSLVIDVVFSILHAEGGVDGNQTIQEMALKCLAQLAWTTFLVRQKGEQHLDWRGVESSWRSVWKCLVSLDLRYSALSKENDVGSMGYLLVVCLLSIVRSGCTDLSNTRRGSENQRFLFRNQNDLWNLPIFQRPDLVSTGVVFDLVSFVLVSTGLSEDGAYIGFSPSSSEGRHSRRSKLVCFCLETLRQDMKKDAKKAASCCVALLVKKWTAPDRNLQSTNSSLTTRSQLYWGKMTHLPSVFEASVFDTSAIVNPMLKALWQDVSKSNIGSGVEEVIGWVSDPLKSHITDLWKTAAQSLHENVTRSDMITNHGSEHAHLKTLIKSSAFWRGSIFTTMMYVKMSLSIALAGSPDDCGQSLTEVSDDILSILEFATTNILASGENLSEFEDFLQDTIGVISTVVNISSLLRSECPAQLVQSGALLVSSCRRLLGFYAVGELSSSRSATELTSRDSFFDDDEDVDVTFSSESKKRNLTVQGQGSRKRPNLDKPVAKPSLYQAFLLASVILAIEPGPDNRSFVAEKLLAVSALNDGEGVHLEGGAYALLLLSTPTCMLHDNASEVVLLNGANDQSGGPSWVTLVISVIEAMKASSQTNSPFHWHSYRACAQVVGLCASSPFAMIDDCDADRLCSILCDMSGSVGRCLLRYPSLRAERLTSATMCLENGTKKLQESLAKVFPRIFVVPALSDIDFEVRKVVVSTVGTAMSLLPEDKVVEGVTNRLPDMLGGEEAKESYRTWYYDKNLGCNEGSAIERQVWEDAAASFRWFTLQCFSAIGGGSANRETTNMACLRLLRCANRSAFLEPLCQRALRMLAVQCSFPNERLLVESDCEILIGKWINECPEDPLRMPLLLSAPHLLQLVVGINAINDSNGACEWDIQDLRRSSASEYVSKKCRTFLPRILLLFASKTLENSVTREVRRSLLEHPGIKAICSVFYDYYDDSVVTRLIRAYIGDVLAYMSIIALKGGRFTKLALEIERLLLALFTPSILQQLRKSHALETVSRMLNLSSLIFQELKLDKSTLQDSVLNLISDYIMQLGGEHPSAISAFGSVGGTVYDLVLSAGVWMNESLSSRDMRNCWNVFEVLTRWIGANLHDESVHSQLIFFASRIPRLLLEKKYRCVHLRILKTTRNLVSGLECLQSSSKLLERFLCETMATVFQVHELAQGYVVERAESVQDCKERSLRESVGMKDGVLGTPASKLDLTRLIANPTDDESICLEILDESYEVISQILKISPRLNLAPGCFIGLQPPYRTDTLTQETLIAANSRFCVQKIVKDFLSLQTESLGETVFYSFSLDGRNFPDSSWFQTENSVEERLLLVELRELEKYLRDERPNQLPSHGIKLLVKHLFAYCSPSLPDQLQVAASVCLGAIETLPAAKFDDSQPPLEPLHRALVNGNVINFLRARCLSRLSQQLRSHVEATSVVAKETLVALAHVLNLSECEPHLEDCTVQELSQIFIAGSNRNAQQSLLKLCSTDVERMKSVHPGNEWCFDVSLWKSGATSSWKTWLTSVVPALLHLNYPTSKSTSERKNGSDVFLGVFQRITSMEPSVAEALFPLVVLDLLGYPNQAICFDLKRKTFSLILDCFNAFLDGSYHHQKDPQKVNHIPDMRTTELVVDTLDLLRRLSQQSFLETETRKVASKKENANVHCQSSYGCDLKGIDWWKAANACIRVKRFASALFYLEFFADQNFGNSVSAFQSEASPSNSVDMSAVVVTYRGALQALGEADNSAALDWYNAKVNFMDVSRVFGHTTPVVSCSNDLKPLRSIDCVASKDNVEYTADLMQGLAGVGLSQAMHLAVAGTAAIAKELSVDNYQGLREQWFESCVNRLSWTDELLYETFDAGSLIARLEGSDAPGVLNKSHQHVGIKEGFHECIAKTFAAMIGKDNGLARRKLMSARLALASSVSLLTSKESPISSLDVHLDKFKALDELGLVLRSSCSFCTTVEENFVHASFDDIHPMSVQRELEYCCDPYRASIREALLRIGCWKASNRQELRMVRSTLFSHVWKACRNGEQNASEKAMQRLFRLIRVVESSSDLVQHKLTVCRLRLQEAIVVEGKGDFTDAIRLAKETIRRLEGLPETDASLSLLADAFILCGTWTWKYKVEPASNVLVSFLRKGTTMAKKLHDLEKTRDSNSLAAGAYLAQAQLLSSLFETVFLRTRSLDWDKAGQNLLSREAELASCSQLIAKKSPRGKKSNTMSDEVKSLRIYQHQLSKSIEMVQFERKRVEDSVEKYRRQALKSIVSALILASPGELNVTTYVFRMIHLWFTCEDDCGSCDGIAEIVDAAVKRVPSFRFVEVSSQLFSRVELKNTNKFQMFLHILIVRICREHPYHCLPQLISLANGKNVGTGVSGRNAEVFLENAREEKVDGANQLISELLKKESMRGLIESYSAIANAYVHLAMFPTDTLLKQKTKNFQFLKISKKSAERLDQCLGNKTKRMKECPCVLTNLPPVRPGCDYEEGGDLVGAERVREFEPVFAITDSGLHRPKIVICVGTKGRRFKQLVKGEDEIRQDAVMEQVFGFVNTLVHHSRKVSGSSYPLRVVTYTIVPLSPASGVLEWVDKTVSFGEFMVDRRKKASGHSRYHPREWSSEACRQKMRAASQESKRVVFDEICDNHTAVFRYFFVERFGHSLEEWHAAKMRFTRSVAINNIVGHILGIGDRHGSNILVHQGTGEVVHIDFGIVFEQGKLLTTPELVPFRLTQNVVDGFGPAGVNGAFLSAAKRTLAILRNNSSALMTILSAIKSDPLYSWSVSPVRAATKHQHGISSDDDNVHVGANDEDENMAATHSIRRVHEKLQGYEDGTAGEQQSVAGQVQLLIASAQDRDNLCQMFPGWQPWT